MKNDRGMTLIEVLVSLAIVFIIFMGLNASGLLVLDENIKNTQRDEAVSIAETEMEQVRNTPFDNVVSDVSPRTVTRTIRGGNRNYTVQRTVTNLDTQNKQVQITVQWSRQEYGQTRTYNHQAITIVRVR